MAFTTPCYVRVDDPLERQKICRKLKKLGYKVSISISDKDSDNPSIVAIMGEAYGELYSDLSSFREYSAYHNCGEDTDLFLALASMRDDTDEGQCFVPAEGASLLCSKWIVCKEKQFKGESIRYDNRKYVAPRGHFRNATVEEIVEHFKNRKK